MNLRRIQYSCSCGSCDECTGGNAKSYFDGMVQVPNIEQIVPIQGPAGKGSVLVAGNTDSSGILNANGTDEAINSTAKTNLATSGFDITLKPTTQNIVDTSDLNNNKIWTGLSRGFLNFIGLNVLPARVKTGGTTGQVYTKVDSTDYNAGWSSPVNEIYNTTSLTGISIDGILSSLQAGSSALRTFTVGSNLAYKRGQQIWLIKFDGDTLIPSIYLNAVVLNYSGTSLDIAVSFAYGTGTPIKWYICLGSPVQFPYFDSTTNNGMFLKNINGSLSFSISALATGFTLPWHNPSKPDGFVFCDGVPFNKTDHPDLYQHLRPGGIPNKYSIGLDGTALGSDRCRTPGYNNGTIPYGVADFTDLGTRFGGNTLIGGIPDKNLPAILPYTITAARNGSFTKGWNGTGQFNSGTNPDPNNVPQSAAFGDIGIGITVTNNTAIGGGGKDLDMRQSSEGCYYIMKT